MKINRENSIIKMNSGKQHYKDELKKTVLKDEFRKTAL